MSVREEFRRLSFEERADDYRHARPPYPVQVYELLAQRCGLGPGTRVLEIGAGTGQATRDLLARGAVVTAVEPGVRLAAHLAADLAPEVASGQLRVVNDRIETAPLSSTVDIVASATAFHWVRTDVTLPRLSGVLPEGGWLAVWWTVFGDPTRSTPFREDQQALYERLLPTSARQQTRGPLNIESWRDELSQGGWFTRPEVEQIRWENPLTPDSVRRLFGSFTSVNELEPARRAELLDGLADLVRRHGGVVHDPHVTVVYLAQRR